MAAVGTASRHNEAHDRSLLAIPAKQLNNPKVCANLSEEDKSNALKKALTHIHHAEQERKAYNRITAECRTVVRSAFQRD